MENTAKLFVTDYASYNEGKQFEHGHWIELNDFADAEEFNTYITNHFNNVVGLEDFEPMYTDFEGFPDSLYSESLSESELEKIFKYIELDYENKDDSEKVSLWNEYCSEQSNEDEIYDFDEEFFELYFEGRPMEIARAVHFGDIQNWNDNYIKFNGYGNLVSFNNPLDVMDENSLIEWLIEKL
jgi:hypothetical protein